MKFVYRKIICPACIIFTVITVTFSALLSWATSELYVPYMDISSMVQILVYSIVVAGCGSLFTVLPYFGALAIDFAGVVGGAGVIFFLIGGHYSTESGAWALLFVLALIYVIISVIVSVIRGIKKKSKAEPYQRQFR